MSRQITKGFYAALFLSALLMPASSFAHGACKADREKFCKDVPRGDGRIKQCMKEHYKDLSPVCQQKLDEKMKKAESKAAK